MSARGATRRRSSRRAAVRGPAVGVRRLGLFGRLRAWWGHHLQSLFSTLGRMARSPLGTLMTVLVIAIAFALPTGLTVVLEGVRTLGAGWDDAARISLFLHQETDAAEVARLVRTLGERDDVALVTHIAPDAALEELRDVGGLGAAIDLLDENPLPSVLIISPASPTPEAARRLLGELGQLAAVDHAQLDLEWLERLHALMQIGKRAVLVLALVLGLAVLLVIANTIRLSIEGRREEIVVQKLIGATDAFVRRPFLYAGFFHGLFGAAAAWLLVGASLLALSGPVSRMAALYESRFSLPWPSPVAVGALLGTGALLGLLGSWWAVRRHVRVIEPD